MILRLTIAFLHLLTLCLGFYAIWSRAEALKKLREITGLEEVFRADNLWGIAAADPFGCNCCRTRNLVLKSFFFLPQRPQWAFTKDTKSFFLRVALC